MAEGTFTYTLWALALGAVSAMSLPLGSLVGLKVRFSPRLIAIFAAFGAGALIAALSVELVAPTALAMAEADPADAHEARASFFALMIGGILGGFAFVALDSVVNQKGGYLRKTSTTLAHIARRDRRQVQVTMQAILSSAPFDALSPDLAEALAGMLRPARFKQDDILGSPSRKFTDAYIVGDGEVVVEIGGRSGATLGPGAFVGMLALFAPELADAATVRAKTDLTCLALKREDVEHLRAVSPDFDDACRRLAGERVGLLQQQLADWHREAGDWMQSAVEALQLRREVPKLAIRRAHAEHKGSPLAVWLGILLDGIPESIVIGAGLFTMIAARGETDSLRFVQVIPFTLIAGLFLSNFPEALSSSANMLTGGWRKRRIFFMWFALMVMTAVGSALGYLMAGVLRETWLVLAEGVAAGAMLTMVAAAMIPEAAAHGRPNEVGLGSLAGFLAAVLFKLLE